MFQLQRKLKPKEVEGRPVFDACCIYPREALMLNDTELRAAVAYLKSLLVLPKGGAQARIALKAEMRRRKL